MDKPKRSFEEGPLSSTDVASSKGLVERIIEGRGVRMDEGNFLTKVELVEDYKFKIEFNNEDQGTLMMDEPKPLGGGEYPNAGKFLAAAVGNCLCASLAYCVRRHRAEMLSLTAEVSTTLSRNENGRLRISHISVELHPVVSDPTKLDRCKDMFEDFCIVTQSVRAGIHVDVNVESIGGEGKGSS